MILSSSNRHDLEGKRAVFLDRDGTIIEDRRYLSDPSGVVLLPGAAEALRLLSEAGFLLFLFTNQSGVGRGYFPLDAVRACNAQMMKLLGSRLNFVDICIAPEAPDQKSCYRKPNPRFINECVVAHRLDRRNCWMVGDKPTDVETGINAQVRSALIGATSPAAVPEGVLQFPSLYDFAKVAAV